MSEARLGFAILAALREIDAGDIPAAEASLMGGLECSLEEQGWNLYDGSIMAYVEERGWSLPSSSTRWPRCVACGSRFPSGEHLQVHLRRDCLGEPRPICRRLPRPWRPGR